jgi:diguanylate cyclase (GGDEF)-like protein
MRQFFRNITLRQKFLLLVGLAVVAPLLLFYVLARQFVYWNLQILEDDLVLRDMRTVDRSISEQQQFLTDLSAEYASRSDVYRYVASRDGTHLGTIFSPSLAQRFSLDRMFVFDENGTLVYEHGNWNEFASSTIPSARFFSARIFRQSPLVGYVETNKAIYMFSAQRIAAVEDPKNIAGRLVFARQLKNLIERDVSAEISREVLFYRLSEDPGTPENPLPKDLAARFQDKLTGYVVEHPSKDHTAIFFPISDYRGDLIGAVEVLFPREEIRAALQDVGRILALLLVAGVLFSLAMAALLARFTVQPALQLRRQVMDIRLSRDLSQRVAISAGDEIGQVADAFNHLLDALHAAEQELLRKNRDLYHLSIVDELTQLYNRRYMIRDLDREFARAQRYEQELSCMILDLDHFKDVNDTHGHATGDRVLCDVAAILRSNTRQADSIGRWGGEEFLIILPMADREEAFNCAERIRVAVEKHDFGARGKPITLTASIGLVSLSSSGAKNTHDLLRFSDVALYRAKTAGRNRAIVYNSAAFEQSNK